MVVYYISYGEPQRQPLWQPLLLILLITLALAMAAAIAYGIYELASDSGYPDSEEFNLTAALDSLHDNNTNTIILADVSQSIQDAVNLQVVQKALVDVAIPYVEKSPDRVEDSRVALVPFTEPPERLPELAPLETPAVYSKWFSLVRDLKPSIRPAYIYDTVAVAHEAFKAQDNGGRGNVIVLLTDGSDGGFRVVDPTRLAPCPMEILAEPSEVCSPVLKQIPADPAKLVPCPAEVAAAAGEVCNPVPDSSDGARINYEKIDPIDLKACPPELGVANVPCYDVVIGYQTVDPGKLDHCPPGFAEPGNACMAVQSKIDKDALKDLLENSEVQVNIIGLGPRADHPSLKSLAEAGNGKYIHCSSGDSCQVPE